MKMHMLRRRVWSKVTNAFFGYLHEDLTRYPDTTLPLLRQLHKDHAVEAELRERLLNAPPFERRFMYGPIYEEFHRRVPHDSKLANAASKDRRARSAASQLAFLWRFLKNDATFLEIGCGDCALSEVVAKRVREVVGYEISAELPAQCEVPPNFRLVVSPDGCVIPLPPNSVDLAYSNHVVEHLHPDDVITQTQSVRHCLRPGGRYVLITPSRLTGPHDISRYLDMTVATGLHLQEWTATELAAMLRAAGFRKVLVYCGTKGVYFPVPKLMIGAVELALSALRPRRCKRLALAIPMRFFSNFRIVAIK